jgi:hypothetical protein
MCVNYVPTSLTLATDEPRGGRVNVVNSLDLAVSGLITANGRFQLQMIDNRIKHWLGHQRGPSVIKM